MIFTSPLRLIPLCGTVYVGAYAFSVFVYCAVSLSFEIFPLVCFCFVEFHPYQRKRFLLEYIILNFLKIVFSWRQGHFIIFGIMTTIVSGVARVPAIGGGAHIDIFR